MGLQEGDNKGKVDLIRKYLFLLHRRVLSQH